MAYEALYTRGRPKNFAQLIGQEHISTALTRAISGGKLSHAYLLVGTRGTGKTSTARLLAKAMNCEKVSDAQKAGRPLEKKEIPCNKCPSCLSIDSSPDNVEFDAASNRSVEDVTRILSSARLAPLQSRVKTFIIDEVHMLSFEAVNSILKLIEEPPPNVAFFLATTEINKVPMTIRSRCQVLNFRLIPQEVIAKYLMKLARRLEVELPEDAAKKIARLAEGSMRDAMTYLDQCYAMSDKIITLDDVNETLGLVSDADLDEIISAVKSKNRSATGAAITRAFRSGLSSISIAESLITRLRDLEFEILDGGSDAELRELENFSAAIRQAILQMQGSGVPEIILEMNLMSLAAPKIFSAPKVFSGTSKEISQPEMPTGNLDEGRKIFYHVVDGLKVTDEPCGAFVEKSVVKNFSGDEMKISFKSKFLVDMFEKSYHKSFEDTVTEFAGRQIKVTAVVDEKMPAPILERMSEPDKSNLKNAMDIFQSDKVQKIQDEE